MTLTLGKSYLVPDADHKGVYIVDPYIDIPPIYETPSPDAPLGRLHIKNALKGIAAFFRNVRGAVKLGKQEFFRVYSPTGFLDRSKSKLRPYYKAALFLDTYTKKFDADMLLRAHYITHWMDVKMDGSVNNDDLLNAAEELIRKYASARLVITSRIHAALPCLAVNTPVVFIASREVVSDAGTFNVPGRLGGLLEFFRTLKLDGGIFTTDDGVFEKISVFSDDVAFRNKNNWKNYAVSLAEKVAEFMDV